MIDQRVLSHARRPLQQLLCLLGLYLCCGAVCAATIALVGGVVIDGTGRAPIPDGVVVIDHDVIVAIGARDEIKVPDDAVVMDVTGQTVLPGLIDMGVRLDRLGDPNVARFMGRYKGLTERVIIPQAAKSLLYAGITSARDISGATQSMLSTRRQVNTWKWPGPRLRVGGAWLVARPHPEWDSATRVVGDIASDLHSQVQAGVDWVVLAAAHEFSEAQLHQIVTGAASLGVRVTALNMTPEDALAALKAGIHDMTGLGQLTPTTLSPALISALEAVRYSSNPLHWNVAVTAEAPLALGTTWGQGLAQDTAIAPFIKNDLSYSGRLARAAADTTDWSSRRQNLTEVLGTLRSAGVRFGVASRAGDAYQWTGEATVREIKALVEWAGLTPLEAIAAATGSNAAALGIDAGVLKVGAVADMIVVAGDVSQNIDCLEHLTMLFESGIRYR